MSLILFVPIRGELRAWSCSLCGVEAFQQPRRCLAVHLQLARVLSGSLLLVSSGLCKAEGLELKHLVW